MEKKKNPFQVSVRDIALIGMMTAVIEVSKLALAAVPNVELVTFWIIMFSLFFGPKVIYSILVFILIDVSIYGVNVWVIMYLYIWPTLALLVLLFKKKDSMLVFAILSGFKFPFLPAEGSLFSRRRKQYFRRACIYITVDSSFWCSCIIPHFSPLQAELIHHACQQSAEPTCSRTAETVHPS